MTKVIFPTQSQRVSRASQVRKRQKSNSTLVQKRSIAGKTSGKLEKMSLRNKARTGVKNVQEKNELLRSASNRTRKQVFARRTIQTRRVGRTKRVQAPWQGVFVPVINFCMQVLGLLRVAFFGVGVVVLIAIIGYVFVFPSLVLKNFKSENIVFVSSSLDSNHGKIYLAHFSKENKKNTVISLPAQQIVFVPKGYGEYPLQSVHRLLQIEKKQPQFITATFSELFGIAVERVFEAEQVNGAHEESLKDFFWYEGVSNAKKLDFSRAKYFISLYFIAKDVAEVSLTSIVDVRAHAESFKTISDDLRNECSVAVVNASGETGRARQKAQLLEAIGVLVLRVTDSPTPHTQSGTIVYVDTEKTRCNEFFSEIDSVFYQDITILPLDQLENAHLYRSKVVLVLGREE